jgi:hypothetical protein
LVLVLVLVACPARFGGLRPEFGACNRLQLLRVLDTPLPHQPQFHLVFLLLHHPTPHPNLIHPPASRPPRRRFFWLRFFFIVVSDDNLSFRIALAEGPCTFFSSFFPHPHIKLSNV